MKFLTDEQLNELLPAETASFPSPVPTQIVSSDEYLPVPQSAKQREVEARLKELSDRLARRQGLSRRHFFQTAAGMATSFVAMNQAVGKAGWNKALGDKEQTIDDLKYTNYIKEIYLDSDTKVALLSNSPSEVPEDWFIPQEQVFTTREQVNQQAGTRRMMAHFTITPGWPGWLDQVDKAVEVYKPDSWKGYTVGDNTNKAQANHPYHLDDEKL